MTVLTLHRGGAADRGRDDALMQAESIVEYFRNRVHELDPETPDRLRVERLLNQWDAADPAS